jgi:hypothetical protein
MSYFTGLSQQLQQLLNNIIGYCNVDCSGDFESSNAITRNLHHFLQQLSVAVEDELQSNAGDGLRIYIESYGQCLLQRLTQEINHHFQIRPKIMVISEDAEMRSAAVNARGITESLTRLVELLTTEEDRARNGEPLTFLLMDSEDDPEISMRFAILESISSHIVASYEQTHKHWNITVDGEGQDLRNVSGSNTPKVLKFAPAVVVAAACNGLEDFADVKCAICMGSLFEKQSDDSIHIDARQMKCPGKDTFHDHCARTYFVQKHSDKCPVCRLDFSKSFCTDIEAHLEHKIEPNEEEPLQWMKAPDVRLAALNMLAKLPKETPLGRPIASALLWSSLDSSPGIPNAALSTERLSAAFEIVPEAERVVFSHAVLKSLKTADADGTVYHMTRVIAQLSENDIGCLAVLEAGGCGAIVQSLKVAVTDEVIGSIALAIQHLVENSDCGIRCFRQFSEHSVCSYLAAALAILSNDEARLTIANCMSLIFDTAAKSVEDYSAHKIGHLKTLCSSKGISNSGNKKELVARLSELGTIEQKKLLLQGISQSNSTDICKELFVAMSHSASEKTFSEETLLSVLEVMKAIICGNNSDGAAKMFHVNGISQAFTVVLNSSLHSVNSNDVICSVGKILAELLSHIGSASTTDCESFFECASHLGEALVSAWAHSKDDGTKQQTSVAIYDLSAAAQRFQGCQEIVEIKFCKNSSVPELDAAFKLVLVAPRIESNQVKKVICNIVPKFVKGWNEPDHAPQRWRRWTHLSYAQKARIDYFDGNDDENSEVPIVSKEQVLTLVTALKKSKGNVEKYSNISLTIAIIANVSQCMDRFIECARILECFPGERRKNSCFPKSGSIEYSDIFEAIWMGMISASDRRWSRVCSGLCSHIGSMLFYVHYQGKACRPHLDSHNHNCRFFFDSFTAVCRRRGSDVCGSLIYALISTCSGIRTKIIDDDDVANIVQGMLYCIENSEPSLKLFDRDKQFRDALLTAVKSTRAVAIPSEISDWSRISGGMVPRSTMSSRMTTHRAVAKIIDSLNSQELFVSSLQAATSAEEKFRLARCMAHCNMKSIKSSPACKQVIAELISVLNYAKHRHGRVSEYMFEATRHDTVIQKLIQKLDGCDELFEKILHEIEHLVASVQAAPSAADISRLARCMAHFDLKQFDWDSDFKSFRKRGIDALTAALKSMPNPAAKKHGTACEFDQAIRHVSNALLKFIGETGCGSHYDVFKPLSALAISLASVGNETDKCDVVLSISKIGCKMTADQKSSPACKQVIAELISVLKHHDGDRCDSVIVGAIQSLDGCNELFEHLVASVQAAPSAADISRLARCMAHFDLKQFDWDSDFKSFRKRGIDALTAALKSISIKVPMPNPTVTSSTSVLSIRHVSNALLNFIGETGCGSHYDVFKPLSALAISLASVGNETDKCDVVLSISKICCKMTADQKSSPACKQVIAELISVLKHRDISDWCITTIVDAIHVLDGCNELIIALSHAACDSERARLSSAIVTITQRRLKDSAHSESSSPANKKQKIGGAFSP